MVLRHRAREFNRTVSASGFVDVVDLMCLPAFRVRCQSSAALHWVVHNNPKGRLEFMIEHPA
eukprot:6941809-Lingulodinium_polyedra.AAC.1